MTYCSTDMSGCSGTHKMRKFLTKEERIEMLNDYKTALENEAKGVSEKIEKLQKD